MERIVIQSNTEHQILADNFVRAICEDNHIDNYYATISVPVLTMVESSLAESESIELSWGYCDQGIRFCITASEGQFLSLTTDVINESTLLLSLLTDELSVSDNGADLYLTFAIRGIDAGMAADRISTVKKFYASSPTLVKSLAIQ